MAISAPSASPEGPKTEGQRDSEANRQDSLAEAEERQESGRAESEQDHLGGEGRGHDQEHGGERLEDGLGRRGPPALPVVEDRAGAEAEDHGERKSGGGRHLGRGEKGVAQGARSPRRLELGAEREEHAGERHDRLGRHAAQPAPEVEGADRRQSGQEGEERLVDLGEDDLGDLAEAVPEAEIEQPSTPSRVEARHGHEARLEPAQRAPARRVQHQPRGELGERHADDAEAELQREHHEDQAQQRMPDAERVEQVEARQPLEDGARHVGRERERRGHQQESEGRAQGRQVRAGLHQAGQQEPAEQPAERQRQAGGREVDDQRGLGHLPHLAGFGPRLVGRRVLHDRFAQAEVEQLQPVGHGHGDRPEAELGQPQLADEKRRQEQEDTASTTVPM